LAGLGPLESWKVAKSPIFRAYTAVATDALGATLLPSGSRRKAPYSEKLIATFEED
jgi:hypothetical protein